MGGDGGSLNKRAELVSTKGFKRARQLGGMGYAPNSFIQVGIEEITADQTFESRLANCTLTQTALDPPVVIDEYGQLFGRRAIVEFLIKSKDPAFICPSHLRHIRRIKHLTVVAERNFKVSEGERVLWCPLRDQPLSGKQRGVVFWGCGCVCSIAGIAKVQGVDSSSVRKALISTEWALKIPECPVCSAPVDDRRPVELGSCPPLT